MKLQTQLAEQQLFGFLHAKRGYSLISLIEGMGLTEKEWYEITDTYNLDLTDYEKLTVGRYFSNKK